MNVMGHREPRTEEGDGTTRTANLGGNAEPEPAKLRVVSLIFWSPE
jgi:hypothetical protein